MMNAEVISTFIIACSIFDIRVHCSGLNIFSEAKSILMPARVFKWQPLFTTANTAIHSGTLVSGNTLKLAVLSVGAVVKLLPP